jgi:uncharacterized protein YqjF (DUF2071 family)
VNLERLAVLTAIGAVRADVDARDLARYVGDAVPRARIAGVLDDARAAGLVAQAHDMWRLTDAGWDALVDGYAELEADALEPEGRAECPSVPWLTTVQTEWIEALSINYSVDPDALAPLLPAPLEPEIWHGRAWVQLLMSSLRGMRPQGLAGALGVDFYQASYRAAVQLRDRDGRVRRGGFFVRSETNDAIMRAVGNRLREFSFHEFGLATMALVRDRDALVAAIDAKSPHGAVVGTFDTRPGHGAPKTSAWRSLDELFEPLVECYDAFGIADDHLYTLTIERGPWDARFAEVKELYAEYFDTGALGGGAARLDSVLHVPRCAYRWRPLVRERLGERSVVARADARLLGRDA